MQNKSIHLGLKENWKQFLLLVIVNLFVGGMVGMERTIFPEFAESVFNITSTSAIFSFILAFGIAKAIANFYTGKLSNRWGRKRLLVIGWMLAIPIPYLLIFAPSWIWIIAANILLGISQGLTWSSTVVMKIDLVGEKDRGLAMGINEFSGYFAVGIVAFLSGWIATNYGITPYPFYIGIILSILGLTLSLFWIKDTSEHVKIESKTAKIATKENIFWTTTIKNKTLSAITQSGMVNNMNDGMLWGILPLLLASLGFKGHQLALIVAVYPTVWGIGQLFTGKMSDLFNKKKILFCGMIIQGIAILLLLINQNFIIFLIITAIIGIGTALVYPTFAAAIADATHPLQRAESIGIFRLWRDMGYAIGAIISGIAADTLGIRFAILLIGSITILSGIIIHFRYPSPQKEKAN